MESVGLDFKVRRMAVGGWARIGIVAFRGETPVTPLWQMTMAKCLGRMSAIEQRRFRQLVGEVLCALVDLANGHHHEQRRRWRPRDLVAKEHHDALRLR